MVLDHEEALEQQWVEWLRCTFPVREFTSHDPVTIEWALIGTPDPHYSMLIEGTFPYRCCIEIRYSQKIYGWGHSIASVSCGIFAISRWYRYDRSHAISWSNREELQQRLTECLPRAQVLQEIQHTNSDTQLIEQVMLILSAWGYFVGEAGPGSEHA